MRNEPALPGDVWTTRRAVSVLACLFLSALLAFSVLAVAPERALAATWTVNTTSRTESEIRAQWLAMQPSYSSSPYTVTPSWTYPYATGALNASFMNDGLKMLNFGRYLAGLPYDITLDSGRTATAQYGAVLMAADGTIGHNAATLPQPSGMSTDFYNTALSSVGSSNVGRGYSDAESFVRGCLGDVNSGNLGTVGHRRWLLNPAMKVTAIGFANNYNTTYSFDRSRTDTVSYSAITWPSAGYFPVEFFSSATPWSITLNPARYDWGTTGQTVTLKRISDGKTWTFNATDYATSPSASADFFSANFNGYGVANAFIFRPVCSGSDSITYSPGDVFEVTLSGGIYLEGTRTPATVTYRTTFMTLTGTANDPEPAVDPEPVAGPAGVLIDDGAAGVTYDLCVTGFSPDCSGGTYVYGQATGVRISVNFTGTKVVWLGPKQPSYGRANVYVDGVKQATVDCYASAADATMSGTLWESGTLSSGPHTLLICLSGTKNVNSTGYRVAMDALQVSGAGTGTRVNETAGVFAGTWANGVNSRYSDRTYRSSRTVGSRVRFTFTGTRVSWIGPRTSGYGKAAVYVDGVYKGTISQYGPTGYRYRVWQSSVLSRGTHTIEIRVLGTRQSASTGNYIVVDGFDVTP